MSDYTIEQLINIQQVEQLLEAYVSISGIACGLMDNDQNIIIGAGLQQVCTQFIWENSQSFARCWRNDPEIKQALDSFSGDLFECRCNNGMINIAMPIIIEEKRLGIFFSGQFFYDNEQPDLVWFKQQAEEFGFELEPYLAAVGRVPVFSHSTANRTLRFLHQLVQMLAETGSINLMRLREQQERILLSQKNFILSAAINQSNEAFFVIDEQQRFNYVNDAACRSLGYSRDELLNLTTYDIDPDITSEALAVIKKQLDQGIPLSVESRHLTKDGRLFPVEITGTSFEYEGSRLGLIAVRNIIERRQAETLLRQREHEFRTLAENLPDNIARYDTQCRLLYINPQVERTFGLPAERLLGKTPIEALDETLSLQADIFQQNLQQALASGKEVETDLTVTDADNGTCIHNVRFVPEYNATGIVVGVLVIGRDITRLREAQQQLDLLSHAIDQSSEGVFLIDVEGRFIYVNQKACRSLGYSNQELTGMSIPDINPDCTYEQALAHVKTVQSLQALTFEVSHRTRSGEVFPLEISSSNFEYNGSRYILSLAKDISERKQVEQELSQKQQNLKELALELALSGERERRQIAAELHDTLGQDLALARMKLGALYKTDLLPDQRLFLTEAKGLIKNAISRIRSFTRQLYPPILESAGLEAALECLVYQLETDYNLQISFYDDSLEKNVPREWQIELYNSVRELLINVAKHAGTTSACLSICRQTDELEICVVDYGAGFDADKAVSNPDIDGFGLFTIKRRIMYMHGSFQISSTYGVGTEVIIMVPLKCT